MAAGLALIELDGVARRLLILPPDADPAHLQALFAAAEIDAVVTDSETLQHPVLDLPLRVEAGTEIKSTGQLPEQLHETEWVMLTSGTK